MSNLTEEDFQDFDFLDFSQYQFEESDTPFTIHSISTNPLFNHVLQLHRANVQIQQTASLSQAKQILEYANGQVAEIESKYFNGDMMTMFLYNAAHKFLEVIRDTCNGIDSLSNTITEIYSRFVFPIKKQEPKHSLSDTRISGKIPKRSKKILDKTVPYKRPNFSKQNTKVLKDWLQDHRSYAYPTMKEKMELCEQTGIPYDSLNDWFVNARRRLLSGEDRKKGREQYVERYAALSVGKEVI